MELVQTEDLARLKRDKTREAINLALEQRWEEAVEVNRTLLHYFHDDVEAYNRLGKALLELGHYNEARAALEDALRYDPHNQIARKNLERISHLKDAAGAAPRPVRRITPHLFIEESGKSATTVLQNSAPQSVLAKMSAGDVVNLQVRDRHLAVENAHSECLGTVEPRLAVRLIPLMKAGNRYEAAIVSVSGSDVTIIIREVYRAPSTAGVPSFPVKGTDEYRAYLRSAFLPLEEEEDTEEEEGPEWQEPEEPLEDLGDGAEDLVVSSAVEDRDEEDEEER